MGTGWFFCWSCNKNFSRVIAIDYSKACPYCHSKEYVVRMDQPKFSYQKYYRNKQNVNK